MDRTVIVGGAAAGYATAENLRLLGYAGEVAILSEEGGLPYDRPPLSKQVLSGACDAAGAPLMPARRLERIDADVRSGARAVGLDVGARSIAVEGADPVGFDAAVIATGVRPRQFPGASAAGLHVLRTLDDALALRRDVLEHRRLVVVGAGFLGLEAAATARSLGASVTVVEPQAAPMADRIGPHAARRLLELHAARGVELRIGVGVTSMRTEAGRVRGVELSDGSCAEGDVVLVAIGCAPNVEWLAGSGIAVADGVTCDEFCAAAPGVWAAGDVASWHHLGLDRRLRVEHRINAGEQGACVARNIMGEGQPFTPTPFFWTDHFDTKIQLAGVIPPNTEGRIEVGDPDGPSFVQSFSHGGRLVAVLGWNAAKELVRFRRELKLAPVPVAGPGAATTVGAGAA